MKTITTKIKWRNAAEELPKESCKAVVWIPSSDYCATLSYSAKHKLFNALDFEPQRKAIKRAIEVSHWCYKEEMQEALFPKKTEGESNDDE